MRLARPRAAVIVDAVAGAAAGLLALRLFGAPARDRAHDEASGRGRHERPAAPASVAAGYERGDASARGVFLAMAGFAGFAAAAVGGMMLLLHALAGRDAQRQAGFTAIERVSQTPPPPRLQADPVGDLARLHGREAARTGGYARLDAGTAQIPIGRAMLLRAGQTLDPPPEPRP